MDDPHALRAHISELEELVDDLLVDARMGCDFSKKLMVDLHKQVMQKRERLKGLHGRD